MRRTRYTGFIQSFRWSRVQPDFPGGTTYRVDDNGNVSIVKLAGYNYALFTLGGGFGMIFR